MSRGRTYARAGQVVDMHLLRGEVRAEVQGSQPEPFESVFSLRIFDDDRTAELVDAIRATPGMLAEIVSGSLPQALGPLLLPQTASELDFDCTCPDPGWPCKHVAAVALLTAEEIDERPLGILTLRGVDLDTLIAGVEREPAATRRPLGDRTRPCPPSRPSNSGPPQTTSTRCCCAGRCVRPPPTSARSPPACATSPPPTGASPTDGARLRSRYLRGPHTVVFATSRVPPL